MSAWRNRFDEQEIPVQLHRPLRWQRQSAFEHLAASQFVMQKADVAFQLPLATPGRAAMADGTSRDFTDILQLQSSQHTVGFVQLLCLTPDSASHAINRLTPFTCDRQRNARRIAGLILVWSIFRRWGIPFPKVPANQADSEECENGSAFGTAHWTARCCRCPLPL